jgi:hypothetical protein
MILAQRSAADNQPDELLPGLVAVVEAGQVVKFVSKPASPSVFALPEASNDPSVNGATVHFFDTVVRRDGDFTFSLPPGPGWSRIGSQTNVKGYKYKGAGTPDDPCTVVFIKPKVVEAVCRGAAVSFTLPFQGDLGVILTIGKTKRYCADFGGTTRGNPAVFEQRGAPPPGACPTDATITDRDGDGSYRLTAIGDSNTVPEADYRSRTSWVDWFQTMNLLPQVQALKNGVETLENVVWTNGAVRGWSCVSTLLGSNDGLVWIGSSYDNHADGVVVAAGTNDLEGFNATPQDVVNCYLGMQSAAEMDGLDFFVATTPPVYPPYPDADTWNELTSQLNALVRLTFDAKIVIDFDTGFTPDMYLSTGNGRHLNDIGEQLRAQRVAIVVNTAQEQSRLLSKRGRLRRPVPCG